MKNSTTIPHFSKHRPTDGFLLPLGMRVGGENGLPALPIWVGRVVTCFI